MHLNNSKINTMKINYIRVSTGTQSKEVQEFNLSSEYKVFKEVVSGSIAFAERTEGAKIIQLVKEGKVEEILIHDISRIGRNNLDILKTIEFWGIAKSPALSLYTLLIIHSIRLSARRSEQYQCRYASAASTIIRSAFMA